VEDEEDAVVRMSLAAEEILELSEQVLRSSNKVKGIEAEMVTAIALIESSGNVKAYRYEEHLGEASSGLTQLLQSTAKVNAILSLFDLDVMRISSLLSLSLFLSSASFSHTHTLLPDPLPDSLSLCLSL